MDTFQGGWVGKDYIPLDLPTMIKPEKVVMSH
jgi:hypothetical protein